MRSFADIEAAAAIAVTDADDKAGAAQLLELGEEVLVDTAEDIAGDLLQLVGVEGAQ